jgi:hypothetical protein
VAGTFRGRENGDASFAEIMDSDIEKLIEFISLYSKALGCLIGRTAPDPCTLASVKLLLSLRRLRVVHALSNNAARGEIGPCEFWIDT